MVTDSQLWNTCFSLNAENKILKQELAELKKRVESAEIADFAISWVTSPDRSPAAAQQFAEKFKEYKLATAELLDVIQQVSMRVNIPNFINHSQMRHAILDAQKLLDAILFKWGDIDK